MLFATQGGGSFSTSRGYVDLQRSPLVEVLLMSSTYQSSPRADSTVPSSSPCATTSKWSLVFRTQLRFPSTTLWLPFLWAPCSLGIQILACVGQLGEDQVHLYGICERYETQRSMAGAGGIGYRFNLAPTFSTRVPNDVNFFPHWRKPPLRPRPGEGGSSRLRTSVSGWVQIQNCLCGLAGDHSST